MRCRWSVSGASHEVESRHLEGADVDGHDSCLKNRSEDDIARGNGGYKTKLKQQYILMAMNHAKPTKEGHLKKYRNVLYGWSKRFFKLERSYLHYFESRDAPEPVGSITRGDIEDVKESAQYPGKDHTFELHTKSGQIWYLQADSADDMIDWMHVLMPQRYFSPRHESQGSSTQGDYNTPVSQPSWQGAHSPHGQQWPSLQGPGHYAAWQGPQGPYMPPQQGTPPMQGPHMQFAPQFDPRMFAAAGPLYDPRVHGVMPYTPPPPYSEEARQAEALPSKTSQ